LLFWRKQRDYRLIIGLGNPGEQYKRNRHNIGYMCVDYYAGKYGIRFNRKQANARIGSGELLGFDVMMAKPETFMNRSGEAVKRLYKKHQIKIRNIIVIHDDLDLAPGKIRIRSAGSSAGHKGVTSIIDLLGRNDFYRIRVGIGRPEGTDESTRVGDSGIISYVLGDLTSEEDEIFREVIPRVGEAIDCLITEGLTVAMNRFNKVD